MTTTIKNKVFWDTDTRINNKILNKGMTSKFFGLDVNKNIYLEFCSQSNMIGYYRWNPIISLINDKLETYNFNKK